MPVQFGPFHLDAENACVWRGTEALHLTPKAFAVLCALLARPGRLVTKDELWQSVWPGIARTSSPDARAIDPDDWSWSLVTVEAIVVRRSAQENQRRGKRRR